MTDTPLPFPRRGLDDNWAHGQQPAESTRDAQNVRSVDPTTGRTRGAQRSGMVKHTPGLVGSDRPVRLIRSTAYDPRTIGYEAAGGDLDPEVTGIEDAEQQWAEHTGQKKPVTNIAVDQAGGVYAIAGRAVEKRNSDGKLCWTHAVPTGSSEAILGPIVVDTDLSIYVGVEVDTTSEGAAVYKISQVPVANTNDTIPETGWTWVFDRWVRELRLHKGTLKCLVQNDSTYRSHVVTMVNINLPIPHEQGQYEVPYPSTCMVIKDDGSSVTGHPYFTDRDSSPKQPGVGISLESWTSTSIDDYENRIWSSYRAQDLLEVVDDGGDVTLWPDRSGNGRNLRTGNWDHKPWNKGPDAPTLRVSGSTGLPSVYFDGFQGLFSEKGGGKESKKDACKTMIPNHSDGAYCIMIVCRPSSLHEPEATDDYGKSIDQPRWLFQQFSHKKNHGGGAIPTPSGMGTAGKGYNESYRNGILVNTRPPLSGASNYGYAWDGKWNGEGSLLGSLSKPGYLQAYTSSSGLRALPNYDGSTDALVMPANKGSAWGGKPRGGRFDNDDGPGEGLSVITFMHCGGLDEAFAVSGTFSTGVNFVAETGAFDRYPVGATGTIWVGADSDTVEVLDGETLTITGGTSNIPDGSGVAAHVVWSRNWMSRSLLRINGEPIDRWEALELGYCGANSGGKVLKDPGNHPTGLGFPSSYHTGIRGFLGEIMEIQVFGRRETNDKRVSIGGVPHALYPAVLDHPMYGGTGHTGDNGGDDGGGNDKAWVNVGQNIRSSEMEKLEGELMHRHGISSRLPRGASTTTVTDASMVVAAGATAYGSPIALNGHTSVSVAATSVSPVSGPNVLLDFQVSEDSSTWVNLDMGKNRYTFREETAKTLGWPYVRARVEVTTVGATLTLETNAYGYAHPHATGSSFGTYDIPILSNVNDSGQAWVPRKRSSAAMIVKHDPAGRMLWCLLSEGVWGTGLGDIFSKDIHGNVGAAGITDARPTSGLALDTNEDVFVVGPGGVTTPANNEQFCMGLITDDPISEENPQVVSRGFWKSVGDDPSDNFKLGFPSDVTIRCTADDFDNLYVPVPPGTQFNGADAKDALRVYGRDAVDDEFEPLIRLTTLGGATTYQNGYAVGLPVNNPPYVPGTDFAVNGIQRSEYVYLGLETDDNNTDNKAESAAKWAIVQSSTLADSQGRSRSLLAVSGGVVYKYSTDTSAWVAFDGADDPSLSADAIYYWGLNYRQKVYLGDGRDQVVYDPKLDTLTKWESGTSGEIPEKCALAVVYHARIVMARAEGQPQNWFMSAAGDPNNWDFFPPTQSATQAVYGNNTAAEQCPDIINTLVPHNDDYLLFGCDHSIWLLRGDPVDAGQFDEISSTIGMAFGKSWCKDPTGLLYFFGSKGGVYRMAGDGAPQHLSDARDGQDKSIQDRLKDIDLSEYRIQLEWDFERQGLILLQLPYSETITAPAKAWFWDVKNNAWWEDLPGSVTLQPYSSYVVDGDSVDDRRVVYGCEDGFVREINSSAADDDGVAIDSHVTIGPIAAGGDTETVLRRLRAIFAAEQYGCNYTIYVSDTPSELGTSVDSGHFGPGMGPRLSVNKRGSFIWVKLRDNVVGQRWALEELQAELAVGGMRRARG